MKTVVLLTAGMGTRMGHYGEMINKTLLPIKDKAIISHVIEQFPLDDTRFVVALGYKAEMVQTYLTVAYPEVKFLFAWVDDFDGPLAGPACSVSRCRHFVDGPFYLVACDGLYPNLHELPTTGNYVGVAEITPEESRAYCNVEVDENGAVTKIVDKSYCESRRALCGVYHIQDHAQFFDDLGGTELSSGFKNLDLKTKVIDWTDLGTLERYQRGVQSTGYDFSKTDEFIYLVNGRVIKWFKDSTIAENRVRRGWNRFDIFPIIHFHNRSWYAYDFVPGKVLYGSIDEQLFEELLVFLKQRLWLEGENEALTPEICRKFYHEKTIKRLQAFMDKYPHFNPTMINGKQLSVDIEAGLNALDWNAIFTADLDKRASNFHGDLQFDNVLRTDGGFKLIDWRQDFAGNLFTGDKYYDVAKMTGGMLVNYDLIKKNGFTFDEDGGKCWYTLNSRDYSTLLTRLKAEFPSPVIDDIVTLIFLNMAPLHAQPFDKLLFCLALERLQPAT